MLLFRSLLTFVVLPIAIWIVVSRMNAEEALLASEFGDAYAAYRRRTWRPIPLNLLSWAPLRSILVRPTPRRLESATSTVGKLEEWMLCGWKPTSTRAGRTGRRTSSRWPG
jgi:hypothetical protein